MEIRVKCNCGSAYAFEDTPVNGRLAFPVSCTNCGADGTDKAHAYIASRLAAPSDSAAPVKPRNRLFGRKQDDFDELDATNGSHDKDSASNGDETSTARLCFAGCGALAVGAAGAFGWLQLAKATGFEFGFAAWALGGLVGGVARLLAPRGHHWLGIAGAVAALVAIGGGELLTANWVVKELAKMSGSSAYDEAADYAKQAASASSERQLAKVVAEYNLATAMVDESPKGPIATYQSYQVADSAIVFGHVIEYDHRKMTFMQREEISNPQHVTLDQIDRFKAKVLPALKELAEGKPSKSEYESAVSQLIVSRVTFKSLLIQSMGPFSWIWILLGVGTAYKLARNPGLQY